MKISLMLFSATVIAVLGTLHLVYTFFGTRLHPEDEELRRRMQSEHPRLTRRTTMWDAWVGFNASHSLGAILFGAVFGYLALMQPALFFASPFLLATGLAMLLGLTVLGWRYWFRTPFVGIVLALVAYVWSMALAVVG